MAKGCLGDGHPVLSMVLLWLTLGAHVRVLWLLFWCVSVCLSVSALAASKSGTNDWILTREFSKTPSVRNLWCEKPICK